MESATWKNGLRYFLIGIAVAAGGMFFSDLAGGFFNGMPYGDAAALGMGMYLCVVVVTCTGITVSHMDKKRLPDGDTPSV